MSDSERGTVVCGGEIENECGSLESPGVRGLVERGRSAEARGEHVGVDHTWIQSHHGHPLTHLLRHRLAQPFYGPLRGAVGSHQRRTGPSPSRRHIHYYAFRLLPLYHERDEVAQHVRSPFHVRIHHLLELLLRNLPQLVVLVDCSGIVH